MKTSAAEDGGIMGALALLQKWTVQMVERSYISATHGRCFMAEHVIAVDAAREELIREMDRWAAHVRTEHAQKHPGALWGTPGEDD